MNPITRRRALLIGIENYADSRFARLPSVRADTWYLEQVLAHRQIGAFWPIRRLTDLSGTQMREEIERFRTECDDDELALLYVSGHGVRDTEVDGQFYFATSDTDYDDIAGTAVSSTFVDGQLRDCVAPQKIVMIDCCYSGGFALGFRTSDDPPTKGTSRSAAGPQPELKTRGVYVLSSSRAGEASFPGTVTADVVEPSVFTGEVVDALASGRVARDGSGMVTVDALYDHVCERMRRRVEQPQIPVMSAVGIEGRIVVASCPQGSAPRLTPMRNTPAATTIPMESRTSPAAPGWAQLLAYYRNCVRAAESKASLISVDNHDAYVCIAGEEQILSGALDNADSIVVPTGAAGLVDSIRQQGGELWSGYPVVYFSKYPRSRDRRVFAPLLIRRVELVVVDGQMRMQPTGPVLPHPRLAIDFLGEEERAYFAATYQPGWHAGQFDKMAIDIRYVLTQDFGLSQKDELRPDQLEPEIETRTPFAGARNVAVLFRSDAGSSPAKSLMKDLEELDDKIEQIDTTALAALVPELGRQSQPAPECDPAAVRVLTPMACNAAQEAIIRSAMAQRLTVATGPPGTGKSQLVVNLVATAVAAGQKVLVASTNNAAVNEVWKRCDEMVSGCVVRTGSGDARTREVETLGALRVLEAAASNIETADAELEFAARELKKHHDSLTLTAMREQELHAAGRAREDWAWVLGLSTPAMLKRLEHSAPESVATKARSVAQARFFGRWRRRYLMRHFRFDDESDWTSEKCTALAEFAQAEANWRSAAKERENLPGDSELTRGSETAENSARNASITLLDSVVRTAARDGRRAITELIEKLDTKYEWWATDRALPFVRGWAVTCLKTRRFRPAPGLFDLVIIDEASQCAIPYVLPLLFRARRALIIGDPMQLQHIHGIEDSQDEVRAATEAGIPVAWFERRRLSYIRDSAFHAAEQAAGKSLLLNEHYRCHPDIAAVANDLFYGGDLTVLTDVRLRPAIAERSAIEWKPVAGHAERGNSGGSWINHAEIAAVIATVKELRSSGVLPAETTIGVVTPFRAQSDELGRRLRATGIRVGTVHVFQGGECDVMIFSLVATVGMAIRSINWIDQQLNLWNVAITRARSHLIVIGDPGVWQNRQITARLIDAEQTHPGSRARSTDAKDPLSARFYEVQRNEGGAERVRLGATVSGYRADALIEWNDRSSTAKLLDRGYAEGLDPGLHLRLMLRRCALFRSANVAAQRVPAWELFM